MGMEDVPIFFDLQRELTTNPDFADDLQKIMSKIITADSNNDLEKSKQALTDLLIKCDFNPSLLLPYFFPAFTDAGPMTLWSRPHAFAMMAHIPNGVLTVAASRQIGKCICGDTNLDVRVMGEKKTMTAEALFNYADERLQRKM